jgi:hypothetical protein
MCPFLFCNYNDLMPLDPLPPVDDNAQIYQKLRNQLLNLDPEQVNITPTPEFPNAWACLMEFILSNSVVTLAAVVDGTASIYFSSGGGILGSGNHNPVGEAARKMVSVAETVLDIMEPAGDFPLPAKGSIRFFVLTHDGVFTAECPETEIVIRKHKLSGLYTAGENLITQIRLVSDKKAGG